MYTQTVELVVNIPSVEDFAAQYPQYGNLARNEYRFLFDLLVSPKSYVKASTATLDLDLPAVAGIARICYEAVQEHPTIQWENKLKQFVGAVICTLMTANGFEKTQTKKAIPHQAFTKGEVYRLARSEE